MNDAECGRIRQREEVLRAIDIVKPRWRAGCELCGWNEAAARKKELSRTCPMCGHTMRRFEVIDAIFTPKHKLRKPKKQPGNHEPRMFVAKIDAVEEGNVWDGYERFDRAALRSLRIGRRLTSITLANMLGVSQGTVVRWETGTRTPTIDSVELLARALGVRVKDLEGGA